MTHIHDKCFQRVRFRINTSRTKKREHDLSKLLQVRNIFNVGKSHYRRHSGLPFDRRPQMAMRRGTNNNVYCYQQRNVECATSINGSLNHISSVSSMRTANAKYTNAANM